MKTVGFSDIGNRRSKNEDAFRFGSIEGEVVWAVVCDGMGGAAGGTVASNCAVDIISEKIEKCYNKSMGEKSIENLLLSAITTANVAIYDKADSDMNLSGMGTTVVACIIRNSVATIAHVGDSRAYLVSDNKITQITKDHSLVQEMLDSGEITIDEFKNHPNKNIITRALGVGEKIDIDFDTLDVKENDVIILCTDGLSGCVSEEEMFEILKNIEFEKLATAYINEANHHGGPDNITVVAVKC